MSKRSRSKNTHNGRRDDLSIANFTLPSRPVTLTPLTFIDRRRYHPEQDFAAPLTFAGRPASYTVVDRPSKSQKQIDRFGAKLRSQTKAAVAFAEPTRLALCVRRNQRKEVLHATGKAGKRGQKKPRRNFFSRITCRY